MYDNLIKKHAGKCYRISGKSIPYSEILQQAYLIAYNSLASWIPDKGSEPAWVEYNLKTRLGKLIKKENKSPINNDDFGLEDFTLNMSYDPERIAIFKDSIENLSNDAKEILHFILNNNMVEELNIESNSSPREIRGSIVRYFSKKIPYKRTQRAIRELKQISTVIGELNEV